MKPNIPRAAHSGLKRFSILVTAVLLFTISVCAQERSPAKAKPSPEPGPQTASPTFDSLLAADTYKLYGEVRNVGQLLSTGGAGETIDPIMKLSDPPKEFKSIVKFLKANSEALFSSRLLFAGLPTRQSVPNVFVAIEFSTAEEANKFAPKLETFLPTVLPPVPAGTSDKSNDSEAVRPTVKGQVPPRPNRNDSPGGYNPSAPQPTESLPFTVSHVGTLVFISDRSFKFEKLHPPNSKLLAEDGNFRVAHDRFASEPIFLFFNVALEEQTRPQPSPSPVASSQAQPAIEQKEQQPEPSLESGVAETQTQASGGSPEMTGVLMGQPESTPEPEASPATQAQTIATNQAGRMLDYLGLGEAQWPEAIGVALALDNNEYVIRSILIDPPNAKRRLIPFIPQLIPGPPAVADVSSVLPEDTEVFVSVSIDFAQTYEGMRNQAEARAKAVEATLRSRQSGTSEASQDPFLEFEKKAGFKVKEDLIPAFGNEIAIAGSLKSLQGAVGFPFGMTPSARLSEPGAEKDKKQQANALPLLVIAVKDHDAAARLMPQVLSGLGIGQANMLAQRERRGDAEMVSYAGMFAYAFVGDFLVVSDAATVRQCADAYTNHQTLSANNAYRNASRWEPRQNLGQIYISPALMETYQQEAHKHAATMDPAMRDFLMKLSPESGAITYALSNDGLGSLHELHLPKNLILTMVAGVSSSTKNPPPEMNEAIAMSGLQMIANAEASYKVDAGGYGSLEQLTEKKLVSRETLDKYGYKFEVIAGGDQFEAIATPLEYGKTGKRSFFVDQSNVVRGDDHGGGAATAGDKPVQSP
jgi:hypothetical protein